MRLWLISAGRYVRFLLRAIIKSSVKYKQSSSGFPLNVVKVMKSHAKI